MFVVTPFLITKLEWWSQIYPEGKAIVLVKVFKDEGGTIVNTERVVIAKCVSEDKATALFKDINKAKRQELPRFNVMTWNESYSGEETEEA